MGVHLLSRQFPISGCVPSDCEATVQRYNINQVKRSLFGPVDHEEAMSFFQKELAKMEEEKTKQWNFDFVNDRPLPGYFNWEKVEGETSAQPNKLVSKMTCKVTKSSRKCPLKSFKRPLPRVDHDKVHCNRQTTITDFMNVTKKGVEEHK